MRRVCMLWCSLSLLASCADDLAPASRIDKLRLLAVQADLPFAQAGQTVQLQALAIDPEARPLQWAWGTCVDASSSLALDCLRALSFDALTIGTQTNYALHVPATTAPSVGVVVVVCPGAITPGDSDGIPLACQDDSGRKLDVSEFEVGLKRIYNQDSSLNHNPQIASVSWDGQPWLEDALQGDACARTKNGGCDEWTQHAVEVSAPDAAETSLGITERTIVSFYASGGKFDDDIREADDAHTKWRARAPEDSGQLLTFWFVLRDDRGGVSWTSRRLQVP